MKKKSLKLHTFAYAYPAYTTHALLRTHARSHSLEGLKRLELNHNNKNEREEDTIARSAINFLFLIHFIKSKSIHSMNSFDLIHLNILFLSFEPLFRWKMKLRENENKQTKYSEIRAAAMVWRKTSWNSQKNQSKCFLNWWELMGFDVFDVMAFNFVHWIYLCSQNSRREVYTQIKFWPITESAKNTDQHTDFSVHYTEIQR